MKYQPLYENLLDLMREAGKIMLSAHDIDNDENVTAKPGSANFVTVFDVRVQDFLMNGIKKLVPDAVFIAEEKENDPAVLAAEHCFIIDPIDGTTNFICDYRHSAISLALFSKGVAVFGAVLDPYLGDLFTAELGKGAFCNGKPIHVSTRPLDRALAAFGTAPYDKEFFADKTFALCKKLLLACGDLRRGGSAALDLAYVAAGRIDVFFEYRLSPWDVAAGSLLITEAGGVISDMNGTPLNFATPSPVLAASKTVYGQALQIVKE